MWNTTNLQSKVPEMSRKLDANWTFESPDQLKQAMYGKGPDFISDPKDDGERMMNVLVDECFPTSMEDLLAEQIAEEIRKEVDADILRTLENRLWDEENGSK